MVAHDFPPKAQATRLTIPSRYMEVGKAERNPTQTRNRLQTKTQAIKKGPLRGPFPLTDTLKRRLTILDAMGIVIES